ncbi:ARM repeat-containing protein, partial [Fistulina hepatica ATCC 64428]
DSATSKQLVDKIYEKRKAGALELEKQVRECFQQGDPQKRIDAIIEQLIEMFSNPANPLHVRNGGLIGLAGTAIAMGVDIAPYMSKFVYHLLNCFVDPENRIRYFSAECLYNITKVSKGEILVYFNEIFDALSKLAPDSELSVRNGAELLDRLLKDVVADSASIYVPLYPETLLARDKRDEAQGVLVRYPENVNGDTNPPEPRKAFSLAAFIPLLRDRIYVVSPFSRSYLVSWITHLDSVPELELISYLPEFLDGLLKYLSDPTEDVRVATESLLGEFLREIRNVSQLRPRTEEHRLVNHSDSLQPFPTLEQGIEPTHAVERHDEISIANDTLHDDGSEYERVWQPGQGVKIDYAAIIEILLQQLEPEHDEIQQSTALQWLDEFLKFAPEVMVPFTPRLIPAILPNLAHHVPMIQNAAIRTNKRLLEVIQALPDPSENTHPEPPRTVDVPGRSAAGNERPASRVVGATASSSSRQSTANGVASTTASVREASTRERSDPSPAPDLFDYQATVVGLTIQFLSEFEETRVAALKWLIMLHQKAPKKILAMDDGTFPVLLKTLSDPSDEVIKHDLQLLAQISSSSEESYFRAFMMNLLELFSTDRKLLESRGSLIIRQLCLNLSTERIYRTFAEILEKEEDLEFAGVIVQNLNMILITSPELADFRKRLKSVETRQDGQALFTSLYRSWCHNAVSVFSLCLLAQAYEHASNLLYIFADLEITVPMLVQVDKLVQLIESPVFTYLRLQLLEPERYPHLFKCLYGLMMLLPQSSAFVSLRNRLNAVNSAGFLHIAPKSSIALSSRSKIARDEIKWQELLQHFRIVQSKHEKARRQIMGTADSNPFTGFTESDILVDPSTASDRPSRLPARPAIRRKPTGEATAVHVTRPGTPPPRGTALSPLNPRARSGTSGIMSPPPAATTTPPSVIKGRRTTLGGLR